MCVHVCTYMFVYISMSVYVCKMVWCMFLFADYKDLCPYEFGENCTNPPPVPKCPKETDSTWKLFWRNTEHGVTLYTQCPGGVNVSSGMHIRMFVLYKYTDSETCPALKDLS